MNKSKRKKSKRNKSKRKKSKRKNIIIDGAKEDELKLKYADSFSKFSELEHTLLSTSNYVKNIKQFQEFYR